MQYNELHKIHGLLLLAVFEKAFDSVDTSLDIFNFKIGNNNVRNIYIYIYK